MSGARGGRRGGRGGSSNSNFGHGRGKKRKGKRGDGGKAAEVQQSQSAHSNRGRDTTGIGAASRGSALMGRRNQGVGSDSFAKGIAFGSVTASEPQSLAAAAGGKPDGKLPLIQNRSVRNLKSASPEFTAAPAPSLNRMPPLLPSDAAEQEQLLQRRSEKFGTGLLFKPAVTVDLKGTTEKQSPLLKSTPAPAFLPKDTAGKEPEAILAPLSKPLLQKETQQTTLPPLLGGPPVQQKEPLAKQSPISTGALAPPPAVLRQDASAQQTKPLYAGTEETGKTEQASQKGVEPIEREPTILKKPVVKRVKRGAIQQQPPVQVKEIQKADVVTDAEVSALADKETENTPVRSTIATMKIEEGTEDTKPVSLKPILKVESQEVVSSTADELTTTSESIPAVNGGMYDEISTDSAGKTDVESGMVLGEPMLDDQEKDKEVREHALSDVLDVVWEESDLSHIFPASTSESPNKEIGRSFPQVSPAARSSKAIEGSAVLISDRRDTRETDEGDETAFLSEAMLEDLHEGSRRDATENEVGKQRNIWGPDTSALPSASASGAPAGVPIKRRKALRFAPHIGPLYPLPVPYYEVYGWVRGESVPTDAETRVVADLSPKPLFRKKSEGQEMSGDERRDMGGDIGRKRELDTGVSPSEPAALVTSTTTPRSPVTSTVESATADSADKPHTLPPSTPTGPWGSTFGTPQKRSTISRGLFGSPLKITDEVLFPTIFSARKGEGTNIPASISSPKLEPAVIEASATILAPIAEPLTINSASVVTSNLDSQPSNTTTATFVSQKPHPFAPEPHQTHVQVLPLPSSSSLSWKLSGGMPSFIRRSKHEDAPAEENEPKMVGKSPLAKTPLPIAQTSLGMSEGEDSAIQLVASPQGLYVSKSSTEEKPELLRSPSLSSLMMSFLESTSREAKPSSSTATSYTQSLTGYYSSLAHRKQTATMEKDRTNIKEALEKLRTEKEKTENFVQLLLPQLENGLIGERNIVLPKLDLFAINKETTTSLLGKKRPKHP